jgi:hypothetical protein
MQHEGLEELARAMKISSYSIHMHLALLQQGALVESVETRIAAGTPTELFETTHRAGNGDPICKCVIKERKSILVLGILIFFYIPARIQFHKIYILFKV